MSGDLVLVLVDGSNVARSAAWRDRNPGQVAVEELRRRLVDQACSWTAQAGVETVVAFDGAGPWRAGSVAVTPRLQVVGSGRREGDDLLERMAARARAAGRAHWIVSSDRALREVAGVGADRVLTSDEFVRELQLGAASSAPGAGERGPAPAHDAATRLADALDEGVRERLERIRRGER